VSHYWPHRATSASELRALNIARVLQECGQLEIIVVDGEGKAEEWNEWPDKEFKVACGFPVRLQPTESLGQKLRWTFDPRSNYPHGFGVDHKAVRQVMSMAEQFDLVWFCKLRTANAFPTWEWPRSVVDIDDVPSTYERSVLQTETRLRRRLSTARRIFGWVLRERLLSERFTVLAVCSKADKRYLENLGLNSPLHVIPNGYSRPSVPPIRKLATPPRIGFIGLFDYEPNLEGITWFAKECWPQIKRQVPDVRLRLVGRDSDGPLKPPGADIDGLGWVADAADEIATWSAMVVPIRRGAGTRGKIAHSLSLKCPVVSTRLGAHGYQFTDGCEVYLADSAEEFANVCIQAIRHPAEAAAMAERAWQLFLDNWTWEAIRPRIWAAVEDCLRLSAEPRKA
jgi:glycosyltransferase involved in cell wall biosynthesis